MQTVKSAFDPRNNAMGFLRWMLALMVILSHAGPVAGFFGGKDLGTQWSTEQSFGGVALCGFFFISGYLITGSKRRVSSIWRFFWHRFLRIFPGWFAVLLVTAFVCAPLAWFHIHGNWDGYWNASSESPWTYFSSNFTLVLRQLNIANMGHDLQLYTQHGILDWNGSAWTLSFEFVAYIMVGVLGLFGALANRMFAGVVAGIILALTTLQWLGSNVAHIWSGFGDVRVLLLFAPFAFGMLFALFPERIAIDDRLAALLALVAAVTYVKHGWLLIGQYAFCYLLMWFAIRARLLYKWDRYGDFSYGLYVIGWPALLLATYFGLQHMGWFVFFPVVLIGSHLYAFVSWHLIEKEALSLKSWMPRWLDHLLKWSTARFKPLRERAQRHLVVTKDV